MAAAAEASVRSLLEFYFSDAALRHDRLMQKQMEEHNGGVPTSVLLKFNRLKGLNATGADIAAAAEASPHLTLSDDGQVVRRAVPFQMRDEKHYCERTVYVEGLPKGCTHATLQAIFRPCGEVAYIQLPRDKDGEQLKGFAFVEFLEREHAEAAVRTLNQAPADPLPAWGSSLELIRLVNDSTTRPKTLRVMGKYDWFRLHSQYKAALDRLKAVVKESEKPPKADRLKRGAEPESVVGCPGVVACVSGVVLPAVDTQPTERVPDAAASGATAPSAPAPAIDAATSSTATAAAGKSAGGDGAVDTTAPLPGTDPRTPSASRQARLVRADHKRRVQALFQGFGLAFVDPVEGPRGGGGGAPEGTYHLRFQTPEGAQRARAAAAAAEGSLAAEFTILEGEAETRYWAGIRKRWRESHPDKPTKRHKPDARPAPRSPRATPPPPRPPPEDAAAAPEGPAPPPAAPGPETGGYRFGSRGMPQRKAAQRATPAQNRQHFAFDSDDDEGDGTAGAPVPADTGLEPPGEGPAPGDGDDMDTGPSGTDSDSDTDRSETKEAAGIPVDGEAAAAPEVPAAGGSDAPDTAPSPAPAPEGTAP